MKNLRLHQTMKVNANMGVIAGRAFLALEVPQKNQRLEQEPTPGYRAGKFNSGSRDPESGSSRVAGKSAVARRRTGNASGG
jgi:hypothetical protein